MSGLDLGSLDLVHFIRPLWLLALPLAVLLPWWWRRARRPSGDWERICDPHLLRWLSVEQQSSQERRPLGQWLAAAALIVMVLALAGPSWQQLPESSFAARDARVIALDLSASMLAEDLKPNRLTRARYALADILAENLEGQTGLVAFAGDAYVVSPLTSDTNTIANLLPALEPEVLPVSGSRADRALSLAAALLVRAGFSQGEILLVTDSADARAAAEARALSDQGIITSVLAVGTVEGAPVPSGSGFVTDRSGNIVIARLGSRGLQELVAAGGGKYSVMSAATGSREAPWARMEGSEFSRREAALDQRWKDAGPYLVLLLLPLAALAFRRGVLFLLPLGLMTGLLHSPAAEAGWWDDLWLRKDQQAAAALAAEEPERAAALAVDPALAGEAWYRSDRFENALTAWSRLDSANAHYNQGNALAHLGEYAAAIEAYDQALEQDPVLADAAFNRQLVEQLLQQQQQEQEQEQDGQEGDEGESQPGESADSSAEPGSADPAEGDAGEEGEPAEQDSQQAEEGEGQDGEPGEPAYAEAWTEEDAQAMEQWLRRIPDDPGGLLRRKFMYQHQRRGAPEGETESW